MKKKSPKNTNNEEIIIQKKINELTSNNMIASYLGNKGYSIYKICLTQDIINFIKKDLTVKPFIQNSLIEPNSFPIYQESNKKIYVPRFWGIKYFGYPKSIKINYGENIDLKFNGELRDYQNDVINAYLKSINFNNKENNGSSSALIELKCGGGKCHSKDTKIMMYDGNIKLVQDIKVGDKLMGDDSTPRTVLSLAQGREMMYDIIPRKGDKYTVNESHILSLKYCKNQSKKHEEDTIIDIPLLEYLKLSKNYNGNKSCLFGFRASVNFPYKKVNIEPYFLGLWLGDVSRNKKFIDICLLDYIIEYCKRQNLEINEYENNEKNYSSYFMKNYIKKIEIKLLPLLKDQNLLLNKHIPKNYKCNSREIRLEILAGLIDSRGYKCNNGYIIIQKNERLIDDIIFLARSLGLAAYKSNYNKSYKVKEGKIITKVYYKTNIHGENLKYIPIKCKKNIIILRKQINDVLNTRIKVEKREIDYYYGFELDGNHRYLLGDFTVTHNTVLGLKLVEIIKKKTIIFVQKTFLKNQWIERIQQFLPQARIGSIQGQVIDTEDKDIVIAMVQSISMKSYPDTLFDSFGFSIHDEVHHMSSEIFSNCLKKCTTLYSLGLSATMNRKDGLTFVFKMYLGEICYKNKESDEKDNVLVKAIDYNVDDDEYNDVERDYRGNIKYTTLISKISKFTYRSDFIINVMENELYINKNQQIILLAHTKELLNYLYKEINRRSITTVGFYIGGMKEQDLKQSENKQIILATYAMAAEALDIKSLTTLLLATPKSDIVQAVGRILREKHSQPLILDIVDTHEPFQGQFAKRRSFYNEKSYKIIRTNNENYIEYLKEIKKLKNDINNIIDYNILNDKYWKQLIYKPRNKNKSQSKDIIVDTERENKCLISI